MATPGQNTQALLEKIQLLPVDRIAEVEDFVDFLKARTEISKTATAGQQLLSFPVMSIGQWPEGLRLHREDLYGDDGR
ncbi:MAG: hypothetical protein ACRESZ_17865 [Methylococcales bacterium]